MNTIDRIRHQGSILESNTAFGAYRHATITNQRNCADAVDREAADDDDDNDDGDGVTERRHAACSAWYTFSAHQRQQNTTHNGVLNDDEMNGARQQCVLRNVTCGGVT